MSNTNNKDIKRKRITSYFIQATQKHIQEEGIENISIRKIASLAGYNSSTLYNYFDNLDQLISYALLDSVFEYFISAKKILELDVESYVTFLLIWREYAFHAFKKPEIFTYVFYSKQTSKILDEIDNYLERFPNQSFPKDDIEQWHTFGKSIAERDNLIYDPCVADDYFSLELKDYILNFCYLLHLGICSRTKNGNFNVSEEVNLYMDFLIDFLLLHTKIPHSKQYLITLINQLSN